MLGKQHSRLQLPGARPSFLSPSSLTEVYAQLCNVARIEAEREAGVHFRPGYEYGPGPEDLHYSLYGPDGVPFYNYLGPEDTIPEPLFPNIASRPGDRTPVLEPPLQPSELQPHYVASHPGLCCCKNGEEVGSEAVSLPSPPCAHHCQQGEDREGKRPPRPLTGHSRENSKRPGHTLTPPSDGLAQGTHRGTGHHPNLKSCLRGLKRGTAASPATPLTVRRIPCSTGSHS